MFRNSILFMILLFLTGCGVMNNPDKNTQTTPAGADNAIQDESGAYAAQMDMQKLVLTDKNKALHEEFGKYQLFEAQSTVENFLHELNTTAQTLPQKDRTIVETWIMKTQKSNINYTKENLLFYPLILPRNCPLTENITYSETKALITVTASTQSCKPETIYQPLFYKIAKTIEKIEIRLPDKNSTLIDNISH